jgi:hypothetical protein
LWIGIFAPLLKGLMLKHFLYTLGVLCLVILIQGRAAAQDSGIDTDPILIRLKAQIISMGDSMPVPYANVVNYRNRSGASSNVSGHFSLEMLNIDTLVISAMGFKPRTVRIPRFFFPENTLLIYMEPVIYPLQEVQVSGDKARVNMDGIPIGKQVDIAPELRGDAFNERPPVLAALLNPLSYWQYYLSRQEIRKRKVREAISIEKNWEMHSRNYNKEVVMLLTGLTENQADDFMLWFNAQNVLPYTATEYEVRAAIREYFMVYARERNGNQN